jgi:FdhD protein
MTDHVDQCTAASRHFLRVGADGEQSSVVRPAPEELPIAIECNGIGYAVLMATPDALEDLALGFALTERLIDEAADVRAIDVHDAGSGMVVRLSLARRVAPRINDRVRHRTSDASCGLCGVATMEQALRPLPPAARWDGEDAAIFRAYQAIGAQQPLNVATGGVHAAAWCRRDGTILMVREDVGRHNAFDKLIGAGMRAGLAWDGGFALLTSRCSYELVEKAVLAQCPLLATISAPTRLALDRAAQAGLALRVLVRGDSLLAA